MNELFEGPAVEPEARLSEWIEAARLAGVPEPTAMCLCTAGASGIPSARMVLMRGVDRRGLRFYTSYFSPKARELAENPHVAAVFYWPQTQRQVRVVGPASQLSEDESDEYFESRPRGHRLAAWASEQSAPLESRAALEARFAHFAERFGDDVPRPHSWGGYLIAPVQFEFWQARPDRMHDRLRYVRAGTGWQTSRLQP
ncbi:MAG TPA: pyridoxamine 5'-phosphate oxidase [Candidatus Acidoferrales bacterium]|nr:pyridoxamine 5'-phosphate oxidase [Candidatus Acidoferrales bacterium]